jgi:hypothetical protein
MKKSLRALLILFALSPVFAETVKAAPYERLVIDAEGTEAVTAVFSENHAVILDIDGDTRFLRGLELELTTSQSTFTHNAFTVSFYSEIREADEGEWEGSQVFTENLAGKIESVYHIPFRHNSGFRRTPYVSLLPEPIGETAFPLLIRVTPAKTPTDEPAQFHLSAKPVPGDEGAVKLTIRYPQLLPDRPVSVLIDDEVADNIADIHFLREGEHHLIIISEDYRTESRRFFVDRGKTTEIAITLKDTVPLLLFEAPDRALIFINNRRVVTTSTPYPIEPGTYDIKIQVGDYTIIKTVQIQKGKTYRIAFTMDLSVSEME